MRTIQVLSASRSGSTLLDAVLANHGEVGGCGELLHLVEYGLINNDYCACGERGRDCPFWSEVSARWQRDVGMSEFEGHLRRQRRFESRTAWPWLVVTGAALAAYRREIMALYRAIGSVGGNQVLVDSSKTPSRTVALSRVPGHEMTVIHLVRDARAQAWSLMQARGKDLAAGVQIDLPAYPPWRAALNWTIANLEIELALRMLAPTRVVFIRYEDFIDDPRAALAQIGSACGLDFDTVAGALAKGKALPIDHLIAGSRMRMQEKLVLQGDFAWREAMPATAQRTVWRLTAPLMKRYGYSRLA